jgi:diguanylate cyclase (GGDEF)-like protein
MDLRSPIAEPNPTVERAVFYSRVSGLAVWAVGWALFGIAWATHADGWLVVFAAWYLAMAVIVLIVSTIPRVRQREADQAWAARFHELAIHDDLTGLYNRRFFAHELDRRIAECRDSGEPLTIALIDLNDFKSINDSFGHAAGDLALQLAGNSIVEAAGSNAVVARTGGDEFAVILPGHTLTEGTIMADALRVALETSSYAFNVSQGGQGWIRAAVGLATLNEFSEAQQLLHQADSALYATKRDMGLLRDRRKAS